MTSKREEERNEKIIRGLMKLPPNRRCINCNSLGPQYVCTNFWTFVCTICSGIHREFTHRVKSVSMSKFTSQEVEALQSGGNQRAREAYLKDWDLQRQRLPNSSDADKVRGFIKAVYVDRKYAGGNKSEKLQKDVESETIVANEVRRASSYHSYSQSPPYDFQYEERLNRKQGGSHSRKPGSDRSLYDRKAVSFVYSPGHFSDRHYEDRFANEGSSSRVSDYSVSSGGDPFRSAPQSPNLQKDDGFSSPSSDSSREIGGLQCQTSNNRSEAVVKRDADRFPAPRPQRSVSSGSFGSVTDPLQSVGSGRALGGGSEPSHLAVNHQNNAFAFPAPSQLPTENSGPFDHFKDPASSPATADFCKAPGTGTAVSIDLFKSPDTSAMSSQISKPSEATDEGWATFDLPQPSKAGPSILTAGVTGADLEVGISSQSLDSVSSSNVGLCWPKFQNIAHVPVPSVSNSWNDSPHVNITNDIANNEWKAFEGISEQPQPQHQHQHVDSQGIGSQISVGNTSSTFDPFQDPKMVEGFGTDGLNKNTSSQGFSFPTLPPQDFSGSTFNQPIHPFMADGPNTGQKSVNPFDASFDLEFKGSNNFLNMSTLQAALPSTVVPSPYAGGVDESWFPLNPMDTQGELSFITAQAPSSQLTNVPSHGPVASYGGNPFA